MPLRNAHAHPARGGQHGPPEAEPHHLHEHLGLVRLHLHHERGAHLAQAAVDRRAGAGGGREQQPRAPAIGRSVGRDTGWRLDGEVVAQEGCGLEWPGALRVDAHHHVEVASLEAGEQFAGRRHRVADVEPEVGLAKATNGVATVVDGGDVDHADPQAAHPPGAHGAQPACGLVEVGEHPLGARRQFGRVLVGHPAATVGGVVAIDWTETPDFCGRCHTMDPELKAFVVSPVM